MNAYIRSPARPFIQDFQESTGAIIVIAGVLWLSEYPKGAGHAETLNRDAAAIVAAVNKAKEGA